MTRDRVALMSAWVVALLLAVVPSARGEVRAASQLSDRSGIVGEPVAFQVVVEGTTDAEPPAVGGIGWDAWDVRYLGPSQFSSFEIRNNRRERFERIVFQYRLTPLEVGELSVPAVTVEAVGRSYETAPLAYRALPAGRSRDLVVSLDSGESSAFVGQPVRVTLMAATPFSPAEVPVLTVGGDASAFDVVPIVPSDPYEGATIRLMDRACRFSLREAQVDGRRMAAFEVEAVLIPRRAGELTLGPVTASLLVETRRSRNPFARSESRRVTSRSESIALRVEPLPEEGRPASFAGLVGRYGVQVRASRSSARVGDPIELEVIVQGPPPLSRVPDLDLAGLAAFTDRFRVADEPAERVEASDGVLFRQTIRPLRDDVSAIPSIELPYFDVDSGRYAVARSAPLALEVEATRVVTASDAAGGGPGGGAAGVAARSLEDAAGGLAHNFGGPEALRGGATTVAALLASPAWIAALAGPPAVWGVCVVAAACRRRSSSGSTRRGASARARRALAEARSADEIARAVAVFVQDVAGVPAAGLTGADAERALADAGDGAAARVRGLLERCDAARFTAGGGGTEIEPLRRDAVSAVEEADRALRGAGRS